MAGADLEANRNRNGLPRAATLKLLLLMLLFELEWEEMEQADRRLVADSTESERCRSPLGDSGRTWAPEADDFLEWHGRSEGLFG